MGVSLALPLSGSIPLTDGPADETAGRALFEAKVRPLLVSRCYGCHSAQARPPKGGLRLDTRAGLRAGGDSGLAVRPGRPDDSLLVRALEYSSELARMPPDGRLDDAVIADVRRWVELGAPDPRVDPE